jgi:hypothetical protein
MATSIDPGADADNCKVREKLRELVRYGLDVQES